MISDDFAMMFNITKKQTIMLPGCPQLSLYHTSLGTVYLTFDKRAANLPQILSQDLREDQDLIPTLKYLKHQNVKALRDLNERVVFTKGGRASLPV